VMLHGIAASRASRGISTVAPQQRRLMIEVDGR
jgi:hypothetical protein